MARSEGKTSFHLALIAISVSIWVMVLLATFSMGRVKPDQVGILVNNLWKTHEVITEQGSYFYNSITSDFYVLDRSEQTVVLTQKLKQGDKPWADHVEVKTRDGSGVDVDVTVNYQIIPDMGWVILQESGDEDGFRDWIRDYVRTFVRYKLGELSTEEFYDSANRTKKANEALRDLNGFLDDHGVRVNSVQIQQFSFDSEYQDKISEKKDLDQSVEREKSTKTATEEKQKTKLIEAEKVKEVAIAAMEGKLRQKLVKAQGTAAKIRAQAKVQLEKAKRQAEALLYSSEKQAETILLERTNQAKAIQAFKEAMSSSEGAKNLVMMEYAKRLAEIQLEGTPMKIDPSVEQFQHRQAGTRSAASHAGGAR